MKHILNIIIFVVSVACAQVAHALSLDTYADNSRLASGKWVKISVEESGMYLITNSQLKQWGFNDPSKVRVYGYGGQQIPDVLSAANYIDDLPLAPMSHTDRGIFFYGVGPEKWTLSSNKVYVNKSNIYSTAGYYFLSDSGEDDYEMKTQGEPAASMVNIATTYSRCDHYEYDRISPGEAGYLLVGESFKSQQTRSFVFDIPGSAAKMECTFVSYSANVATIQYTVNGQRLESNSTDKIPVTSVTTYGHGSYVNSAHDFEFEGQKLNLTITIPGASSMQDCWLDYIAITTTQPIEMSADGNFSFSSTTPSVKLPKAAEETVVWDVTEPYAVTQLNTSSVKDGVKEWTSDYHGTRQYVAWNPSGTFPAPGYVGTVTNQNIHGIDCVDMVIFTLPEFRGQAERIAEMHRNDVKPLSVAVLNVNDVYNEFASGAPDVSALRKCLKMLYDRGVAADSLSTVRYALLIGRATYDNRHLTSQFDSKGANGTIPCWLGGERRIQLSDNSAFGTDDFIAILGDGTGSNLGLDNLDVAVGRIPARTVDEARGAVDKLLQYVQKSKMGTWRNSFLFLADDGDSGIHLNQTENMINELMTDPDGHNFVSKVYVDAYDIVAGTCVGGRNDMYRMLDEGIVWWNYCGHANNHSWTKENMLTYNDINNLYLSKVPVVMAATCDFLRWDSNTLSGGEIFFHERYGGTIAMISATRPVYISDNGYFTRAVGRAINRRNPDGSRPRLGDIYRNAKNNILTDNNEHRSNTNRLRYVLMGDPALRLVIPDNIVRLDSIGGKTVDIEDQVTLMALQRTTLAGSIVSPDGTLLEDFDGVVEVCLYDAEHSTTTQGVRDDNVQITFEQHGDKLFTGSAPVANGRFTLDVAMPLEIANNFRPATLNMFAYSKTSPIEASGINRDFYVFGYDEEAPIDTVAPVIESFVLNHPSFKVGSTVNNSPMAIAQIRDDVGINLSTSGIGHQMTLTLDDTRTFTDVSLFYTPAADGSPSGTINYPLSNLTEGTHTLRLRIWDTSANSCSQEIDFYVTQNLTPTIYEVYTDANPASVEANFYLSHDRPDANLTVTVSVFDLLGRPIWSNTTTGPSDMYLSAPVTWDLCDGSGRRVPRGIYVYRASITDDGVTYDTVSRKLAVTAR